MFRQLTRRSLSPCPPKIERNMPARKKDRNIPVREKERNIPVRKKDRKKYTGKRERKKYPGKKERKNYTLPQLFTHQKRFLGAATALRRGGVRVLVGE
jgi:hypothetical protein